MAKSAHERLRYDLIPCVFLFVFTFVVQFLIQLGSPGDPGASLADLLIETFRIHLAPLERLSSPFAWAFVYAAFLWAFLSLKIPSKVYHGPVSPQGHVPKYSANGTQYYVFTMSAFLAAAWAEPDLCLWIYRDFSAIMMVLNVNALLLCAALLCKGFFAPEVPEPRDADHSLPYLFYRGVELHPRLLGVDVKQWTNCRVGMMLWAVLVTTFALASCRLNKDGDMVHGSVVMALLTDLYLLKFFYWETGYFNTIDIILDRAGYYICWGCLCWVQVFYTFSSFYSVFRPSRMSWSESLVTLFLGTLALVLNYEADRQKETFKAAGAAKCHIWGRPAKYLDVSYVDHAGKRRRSRLLLSGFWGMARHTNYLFELLLALSFCLPAAVQSAAGAAQAAARHLDVWPLAYFFFLVVLLVDRTYRDERKCKDKYGRGWDEYCEKVPYKIVPYVF